MPSNLSAPLPGRYHPALVGVVVETLRRCPDALIIFASTVSKPRELDAVVVWAVSCSGFGGGGLYSECPGEAGSGWVCNLRMLPLAQLCMTSMISSSNVRSRALAPSKTRALSIASNRSRSAASGLFQYVLGYISVALRSFSICVHDPLGIFRGLCRQLSR